MSETYQPHLNPLCPVCGLPLETGDHYNCETKPEKVRSFIETRNSDDLLEKAKRDPESLSDLQREQLSALAHELLDEGKSIYKIREIFITLQDFVGLRKLADYLMNKKGYGNELCHALLALEDHEAIQKFLNQEANRVDVEFNPAFRNELHAPLVKYVEDFLERNGTPVRTGILTDGVDLTAIRNLQSSYDVAVPIARGGLNQGAIADLWGMPTRSLDIAGHNRKVARGKWVQPVGDEDFKNKRVLLFDKDAVSGATIQKAVKMLGKYAPSEIGVYFAHKILSPDESSTPTFGTRTHGLPEGIKIMGPNTVSLENAGDAYLEAHEKLGTLYGQRRILEKQGSTIIEELGNQHPTLTQALIKFQSEQLNTFDSLNPNIPGVEEIRTKILSTIKQTFKAHEENLKGGLYDFPSTVDNFERLLASTQPLPSDFEDYLVKARYKNQAQELAKARGIENPHNPNEPAAAFKAAHLAVNKGFEIALIIGPEGFAYEPYFKDLGIQTIAINIPESGEGEERTVALLDDLTSLHGKKVLIVEDDVRSGATLQKVFESMGVNTPKQLGLYLGQPASYQKIENVPSGFSDTFIAKAVDSRIESNREFVAYLKSKRLNLFKA